MNDRLRTAARAVCDSATFDADRQICEVPLEPLETLELLLDEENGRLDALAAEIRAVNIANGWNVVVSTDFSDTYKIPAVLALIHSEVSEALEAFRKGDEENFVEEIADVLIRTLDLAGGIEPDFEAAVLEKIERNRKRAHRHGGKRL